MVEGAGGPSWYTEFNVFAGLSARSFGRFAYFVTRIAAGRVKRGLPSALRRCGYRTFSLYPWLGAFMGARSFQASVGVQRFRDIRDLGTRDLEPDRFFYNAASRIIERERAKGPLFIFTYLAANHFPWTFRYRPDLMTGWRDPGNAPIVDEYLRRQAMSADDYSNFLAGLKRDFPGEPFLIVRFGDHQPDFAANIIEPGLTDAEIAQRLINFDPRYFTTYYAIDTINFDAANLSSALDTLDAPYPAAGGAGGGRPSARSVVRRTEEDPAALRRRVLWLRRRRRGAALQPDADRRRPDQAALTESVSQEVRFRSTEAGLIKAMLSR